jgi:hypothetical protein
MAQWFQRRRLKCLRQTPSEQDIVYIGPYGKTSELTNPPTVVVNKHAKIVFFN